MHPSDILNYLKQSDPVLTALVDQFDVYPFDRPQQADDLFSGLAKAILYQSISIKAANTVCARLVQLNLERQPDRQFPSASALLNLSDQVLQGIGIPRFKVRYLKTLAEATLTELPTLEQLKQLDDESIIRTLTAVKGIGRWSVQMLLLFQLKRLDVLPINDLGIRSAMQTLYDFDRLPDPATVAAIGAKWQPYRSVASWYLWQSRDQATRALLKAWS